MRRLFGPALCLALVLLLLPTPSDAGNALPGRIHQDQLEVGRALIEVQSTNWPSILPYYAEDIEYHDPIVDIRGIDMMTEFLGRLFGSSPDLVTTIEDEILIDGVYAATWTMTGRFSGVPYSAKGISIIKFRRGSTVVYYQRDYYSENDIMINIAGLDQAAIGFRTFYRCAVDPTFDCPLNSPASEAETRIGPARGSLGSDASDGGNRSWNRFRRERMEIGRALLEINAANWTSLVPYFTDDYEYHDPIVDIYGIDTTIEFLGRLFGNSPDLITEVEDETLFGDVYMATWTMIGQFGGVPYTAEGMSIVKFREGTTQVYYSRDYYTEGDIMAGIPGLDQAINGFRTFYRCAVDPTFPCPLGPTAALADLEPADQGASDISRSGATFSLRQNAPNPFRSATKISFAVPEGGADVSLRVYDVSGRLVRTLVDGFESPGDRAVNWDGRNDQGRAVPPGAYFYELTAPSFSEKRKMVLLR